MDLKEYQHRLAQRNLAETDAVGFEPRVLYDVFAFDGSTEIVFANPNIFRNGERFPIRITHILAQMLDETIGQQVPVGGDERMVQRYAMRIRAHGNFYMNSTHAPLPVWHNVPVASSDVVTFAQATWCLDKPFVLGNRDTFQVQYRFVAGVTSGENQRVSVSFEGRGLYTRQPKRLVGTALFTATATQDGTAVQTMDIESFRNDGTEPLEIERVVIHQAPYTDTANPTGNVRNVRIRIKCNGNGTGSWWIAGSPTLLNDHVPAPLLGTGTTRAIVHKLPGDGWLWYPNEGVRPEIRSFETTREESVVLAFVGYLMTF